MCVPLSSPAAIWPTPEVDLAAREAVGEVQRDAREDSDSRSGPEMGQIAAGELPKAARP